MSICPHCGGPSGGGRFCGNCGVMQSQGAATMPLAVGFDFWQPLPVGSAVQERYLVQRLISRGSFGAVYEVADSRFSDQRRALKELVPAVLTSKEFLEAKGWFLREGQILSELAHPSIPRIWDSFEDHGRLYIVMQYVEGRSLEELLLEHGGCGLPTDQVLAWAANLCDVLEYLHGHSPPVLFRDLKPANVMIERDGGLMLIDFGIATRFAPQRVGTMIGTPGYAPPEQYQGLAEPRSDVYALGATLHHLLTGRNPAQEAPFSFPTLDAAALRIPARLSDVVASSLSFIITERPSSVGEFRQGLRQRSAGSPVTPKVYRQNMRHASRVASQDWSPLQRDLVAAQLPQGVEILRRNGQVPPPYVPPSDNGSGQDSESVLQVQVLRGQAERLAAMGHYAKALASMDKALVLQHDNADLWRQKGDLLRQAGKPGEAAEALRESLKLGPEEASILSSLGWCLAHIGEHYDALVVLEKALVLDPLDANAWSAKGWSLGCLHRLHEALNALEEATQLDPWNSEAWRTRGWCLERLGQEGEALRAFRRAQRAG